MEDIRDIHGLVPISSWFEILRYCMIVFFIVLFSILIFQYLKSRKFKKTMPQKSAEELAFEALREAKSLMSTEQSRDFAFRLSTILRCYIEARYSISATSETTEEFLERMSRGKESELNAYSNLLKNFLLHCDIAKFARAKLSFPELSDLYDSAWQFVEASKPKEVLKEEMT
ncbi:MAG: protein BatD [SAR324 cluster bacterium]|uniref:Protein BatD n=1 Tax=SAR324 cluster bacterium TaxID=2024889 RepID=A0A7X9ILG4_9DELT|nr:protein BatD [SAR324 cluster bacterium]